ncbi:hypothetical protein PAHAL_8G157600 [Panicum hallii]|uniref:Uncharacterized protein n=1 Tax=Panicum hallii TaxID=206008 RepID=A0A2T8I8Y6_9POAL|nr:hypothetical protein PAHAL_8G157600 [Panicum hallii]PVH34146.1 hypothetical protein PAHAL_8G157600 [Panicum hallii]PVH34147.1 hypothetical protein PAHAL_8G157600 [Panicum hallii]PVH34148.1 hypothetical protein PAHAL_8G157600 [Panicum hallii]
MIVLLGLGRRVRHQCLANVSAILLLAEEDRKPQASTEHLFRRAVQPFPFRADSDSEVTETPTFMALPAARRDGWH